ncbi:MAG TPA: serine protein kinase RIO [Thermoplasmataceae archaeon]|nr:serine protein kinase RIO [Thermoplasmataceae archaeon]
MNDSDVSALELLLKSNEFLHHLDIDRKTADLVFDKRTIKAVYEMMKQQGIDYLDFPISSGKESVVFKTYVRGKPAVLKIYKMSTLRFSNIWKYVEGDYRFAKQRIDRSTFVYLWARKEFVNLETCVRIRVPSPRPIAFHKNLLLMSYLGTKTAPSPTLKDYRQASPELLEAIIASAERLYKKGKLVHADLSEYNILVYRKIPYLIDMGQSVPVEHPAADFFLQRDVETICRYFSKWGIDADKGEVLHRIRGETEE